MPLYEYQCKKCNHTFEKIQKFSDPLVKECPKCGGAVEQLLSAPAIQFKGSGWYVTDYGRRSGSSGGNGKSGKAAESSGESRSESKPAESKSSETKASDSKPAKKD